MLRLAAEPGSGQPSSDDLLALADAVREAAARPQTAATPSGESLADVRELARRGHLRMLASTEDRPDAP